MIKSSIYDFELPKQLQCSKPTEIRGIERDEVRLMVSYKQTDEIEHTIFKNILDYLQTGDVLVVNTSGTLKAALVAQQADGTLLKVHFSTQKTVNHWVVELRKMVENETHRFYNGTKGAILTLPNGGTLKLIEQYYQNDQDHHLKLWIVKPQLPMTVEAYLDKYGQPIRYNYVKTIYPQSYYQTVFANEMGSTEMPSAGRSFTPKLVAQLIAKGVQILPILLHTGVASLEANERPYREYYHVPQVTASVLNLARRQGRRIIATGTTVIRALETVTSQKGITKAGKGWTDEFITPERGIFAVNGLLTGFHEPKASHLLMLEALAGQQHLAITYNAAIEAAYQWHEFGDLHLILP